MGQNGSSSADRRMSASDFGNLPSSTEFGENPSATRRFTGRRHSTLGSKSSPNAVGHRRAASTASGTISAAQRANHMTSHSPAPRGRNLASPVPVARTNNNAPPAYSVDSEFGFKPPETILEAPRVNNLINPGAENALELLKGYDTVFLIDDSGSMAGGLWREACQALAGVAGVAAQYDDDGIDIYFLNSREHVEGVKSAEDVRALFTRVQPRGSTPTGARLDNLLRAYLASIERAQQEYDSSDPEVTGIKPINYIIITDGAPTDDPESVIVAAAKRLDKGEFPLSQLGIQFVQIGSDPEATAALEELDDDLSGRYGIRDIVDTTPYSARLDGETLIKILLGGVNKRVDRRGGAAVLR